MQQAVAEINCPICDYGAIARDHEQCPGCNSDVTRFRTLDTLLEPALAAASAAESEKTVTKVEPAKIRSSFLGGLLLGLVLIVVGLQVYSLNALGTGDAAQRSVLNKGLGRIESRLSSISAQQAQNSSEIGFSQLELRLDQVSAQQQLVLNEMVNLIRGIREDIKRMPRQVTVIKEVARPAPEPKQKQQAGPARPVVATAPVAPVSSVKPVPKPVATKPPQFSHHAIRGNETLWIIAKRFYGAGKYYPVLLEHNPGLSIYRITRGERVAVLNDIAQVPRIYEQITQRSGGRLYWRYTVKSGDTLRSLRRRYCGGENCLRPAPGLVTDDGLRPGGKVTIRL